MAAEAVLGLYLHVVERNRGKRHHRLADLVDGDRTDAGEVVRHQPKRERRVLVVGVGVFVDGGTQDAGRVLAVVHVGLLAVQDELAIDRLNRGGHAHSVGAGVGLGNGQGKHQTSRLAILVKHLRKHRLVGEVGHDLQVEQVVLEREGGTGATAQLFEDKGLRHNAHIALVRQAEVAVHKTLRHFVGQALVFAPLEHMLGREHRFPKLAKRRDHALLPLGQREIHRAPLFAHSFFMQLSIEKHTAPKHAGIFPSSTKCNLGPRDSSQATAPISPFKLHRPSKLGLWRVYIEGNESQNPNSKRAKR